MSDDPRLSISFADEAGDGEARWIRLEQVAMPDEGVTMEEAAALIDELYGIDPCEDGLGNGGEEADEEDLPEEEEFLDMARDRLELDICDDESAEATWEAEVDVFRSHRDDGYSLQGERIEVGATTPMSKTVTETVEVSGASYDLQWPYGGGIVVTAGRVREVKGSTVNFAAPVRGRVRISYTAVWDRVALTVRRGAAANGLGIGAPAGGIFAVSASGSGASSKKTNSREEDSASVVAFWRDLAAECALTRPPEDEQEIDQAEIERLCNRDTDWHLQGECWQTIETYNLCNCSGREAPDAPEPVDEDAPCPEGVRPGSWLGAVRRMGEYVDCEGEDREELNDPEFYRAHCCEENPYSPLPRCRETREPYRGGAEIENGPDHWKSLYGDTVRLTPVTPEGGNCGELVKVWAVPEVLEEPPTLPERLTVDRGKRFSVTVLSGGRPPFVWIPPSGVTHLGDAGMDFIGMFQADDNFSSGDLIVMDACGRAATCHLNACIGWQPWSWSPGHEERVDDPEVLRNESFFWDREALPTDYLRQTGQKKSDFTVSGRTWPGGTGWPNELFTVISRSLKYVLSCQLHTCAVSNRQCNEAVRGHYSAYNDIMPADITHDGLKWIVRRYRCSMTGDYQPVQCLISGDRVLAQCYPSGDGSRPFELYWYLSFVGWALICE